MPDTIPGDATTTATIAVGSFVDATIDTAADRDWYRVTLIAGHHYSFSANAVPGSTTDIDTFLRLYNGAGGLLLEDDDGGPGSYSEIHFTATASGTFFISAGTYNNTDTGTYRVRVDDTDLDSVAGNTTSTATVALGGSVAGRIDTVGDHDFFAVTLVAGQAYLIQTVATGNAQDVDTAIMIRGADGSDHRGTDETATYGYNDDKVGTYSGIRFTPTVSGTYFIDVGAYNNETTGGYVLKLDVAPPLPIYTNDEIATQLTTTYWDGDAHHFNVAPGGSLSVNLTAIGAASQTLARAALALWSDVSGITFTETTATAQITFVNDGEDAFTTARYSGGITTSATVNISQEWVDTYGTSLNSYSFQSFVHEIGHALGLGHGGDYNGTADYSSDALYQNDAWVTTVMSYFDTQENSYFAQQGFTRQYAVTPMVADILAIGNLYGVVTTTRTGNTTYGFNSTADRAIFDAANPSGSGVPGYTIIDNGGIDTLDYSRYSANQKIDLVPEHFSSIGGRIGNVSIARGTVIENAIGGTGNDVIIGNDVANVLTGGAGTDILTGGGGNDTFADTIGRINGDTITDFSLGDRIVITSTSLQGFSFGLNGHALTITTSAATASSVVTLTNLVANAHLVANATSDGGVALTWAADVINHPARNDLNGDGKSDIMWRNVGGTLTSWLGNGSTFVANNAATGYADPAWKIAGTGDFDGDGKVDILWRHSGGALTDWLSNGTSFTANAAANANVGTDWQIAGTGDFNGDGRADILWRNANGAVTNWLSNGPGFTTNPAADRSVGNDWQIAGTGDFNGDGRTDILWRNASGALTDWLSTGTGFADNPAASTFVGNDWKIAGTGDFNGDGRDDILWRNTNGAYAEWTGTASGAFVVAGEVGGSVGNDWQIVGTGDYNGDGMADILWRNTNGALTDWFSTGHGFTPNPINTGAAGSDWFIV